ncbi:glycosyl transferase family 2 [Edaphobacter aggregans]|uniref:Glycosyl transferase family 2 n=1 Tax=Edaphobacter aggregans TaxID=570835 RepID=A0A428MMC7_9BACT|nr:glycosyltransferase [Edaphobacter aggregans]RSL18000.1 glycosyl transferase family 2 [Edaphobacter aggregans]
MNAAIAQPDPIVLPQVAESRALPHELKDFRGHHAGETILVCGCGSSLSDIVSPDRFITIGVNDVGRLFQPDYLVVLNPRQQFHNDRFQFVEQSRARAIFTQLNLGILHPHIVRFRLGKFGGVDFSDHSCLHYTRNSPYLAMCLAIHMGATRIGLIGVDFNADHFFAKTGQHPLTRQLPQIDQEYKRLYDACNRQGIEVVNLSANSRLTALPKMSPEEFASRGQSKKSLNVVSYSTTPVAGVPAILARCIASRTAHTCRTVWATKSYSNGVAFDGDVEWQRLPEVAETLLRSADLVIVHNGKVDERHRAFLRNKPIITMAHNYISNIDQAFLQQGFPGVVVGQYQAALPEFKGWHVVPNPVPLWETAFQPIAKQLPITICYTPSGKHDTYPRNHRLYWHSKGHSSTIRVLESLARRYEVQLEVIRGSQVSHAESLAMKRRAHIVIDECVTGSYHRNSLEGLALGCVVVNGVGSVPSIADLLTHCAGGAVEIPFVQAGLDDLERVLTILIERGAAALVAQGERNRRWMEERWDFRQQWTRFWEPAVDQATRPRRHSAASVHLAHSAPLRGEKGVSHQIAATVLAEGLSVVVCQGGKERLPQLGASLANLRQCEGVSEIIVAEMGCAPVAEELARRWADKYAFVKADDAFERARALNIGTSLAEYDLVLWMDNDLIMSPDFISKAVKEMRANGLDYLIPYARLDCLSASDSKAVMQGVCNPADCAVAGVYLPLRPAYGGAGIVKRSFILEYGGISEDFRGWGGEDDAWWHKASLLGRADVTQQRNQSLHHLFHLNSGSYTKQKESNPHYSRNVAALKEISSVRDRETFLKRFQPPRVSWSWENKSIAFVSRHIGSDSLPSAVAHHLSKLVLGQVLPQVLTDNDVASKDWFAKNSPDALVLCGLESAIPVLADEAQSAIWRKTIVIHTGGDLTVDVAQPLQRAGAIVCLSGADATQLRKAGLRPWTCGRSAGLPPTPFDIAMNLLQPLSIVMGGAIPSNLAASNVDVETRIAGSADPQPPNDLPIWMYWEGQCPDWIKACQQTVFRHATDVRLLSSSDFDRLRDIDRDIDLRQLHVAQRADYIRAFLLAKYGGLWIDSDCIVMRPLRPLLDILNEFEFIAHRERTGGFWANDFMAAARDSKIAATLYRKICDRLRSSAPIGWTDLGCMAVTETLKAADTPWFEIRPERIQPVCWSNPAPFFALKNAGGHQQTFDHRAVCYMLSNLTMQKNLKTTHLSKLLLSEGTFFKYLLGESMGKGPTASAKADSATSTPASRNVLPDQLSDLGTSQPMEDIFKRMMTQFSLAGYESLSGPGSSLLATSEIRQRLPLLIQDLEVKSVVDAGCGDLHWMKRVKLAVQEYVGVDVIPSVVDSNQKNSCSPNSRFITVDLTRQPTPKADLIICRDCLVLLSYEDIASVLRNFAKSGSQYLLTTTFANHAPNSELGTGRWRPLNLRRPPFNFPEPLRIINEKCTEGGGNFSDKSLALWRMEDVPMMDASPKMRAEDSATTANVTEDNLQTSFAADRQAPYELAVIVPISIGATQDIRLRNIKACLQALNSQDLDRKRYRVIVVEQDSEPRLESVLSTCVDKYLFSYNPGPFNKGWALNIGVRAGFSATTAVCLMDADILPSRSFLKDGLDCMLSSHRALRPYERVIYLDSPSTELAIQHRLGRAGCAPDESKYRGQSFQSSKGGCIWVQTKLYAEIRGFDERFRGFGFEDSEFWDRLSKSTPIKVLPGSLLHMHHLPSVDRNCSAANARLYDQVTRGHLAAWTGPMGGIHRYFHEYQDANSNLARRNGRRLAGVTNRNGMSVLDATVEPFVQMACYNSRAGRESVSGPGSSLDQTAEIRSSLPSVIRDIDARSLLDAACGDFNWMRHVAIKFDEYIGVDLIPAVIEQNQRFFAEHGRTFMYSDITRDALPKVDLILCRDCLVHYSYSNIFRALKNFKASKSKYLLTTTFDQRKTNADITTGGWRPVNLQLPPFCFPEPVRTINEKCSENNGMYSDKSLGLWRLDDIP